MTTTKTKLPTPLYDRIIVQRDEIETKSKGGIVLPSQAAEKPNFGTVLAVGEGRLLSDGTTKDLIVKTGDKIVFGKYAGTEIDSDGQKLIFLREEDVLAVL